MKMPIKYLIKLYSKLKPHWERFERKVLQNYEIEKAKEILARRTEKSKMLLAHLHKMKKENPPDQTRCNHLKGGYLRMPSMKDYAILYHTFTDGHSEAKCMICGKKFVIGSEELNKMMQSTTNRPSSSEIRIYGKKRT